MTTLARTTPVPPSESERPPTRTRVDVLSAVVAVSVCLLPFLAPAGPGNTAPMDLGIGLAILVAGMWVAREQLPVSLPYVTGVSGLLLGGALAAMLARAPMTTMLALLQDVVLLLWAAVLALGRHRVAILDAATKAWTWFAPFYASVMVVAYLAGINTVAGVSANDGVRASYTFGDPNLAGNYLVVSLFMMAACSRPRRRLVRIYGYVVILAATAFTGSNGAALALGVGLILALAAQQYRRHGTITAIMVVAGTATLGVLVLGFVLPRLDVNTLREQAAYSVPLLRDSVGRSGDSGSERATIIHEGMRFWYAGDITGYGPGQTHTRFVATQAPYPKEAHDDYLAALLERGLVGVVGLVALVAAIGTRCARLLTCDLPEAYARVVPRWWLLAVIGPMMAISGTFYEVLHFRHLWTWLGIVAALALVSRDRRAEE